MSSNGIFPPDFEPNLSLKSLQGLIISHMHNAGKNRGIQEKLVDDVELELSVVVENFSNDVLVPLMARGKIDQNDLFKYYGIYREGLTIRKQIEYPQNSIDFEPSEVNRWISTLKLPTVELMRKWAVPVLTVMYANLNLYYQTTVMRKRYQAFYTSNNPIDWLDLVLSAPNSTDFDPPQDWVEISTRWSYMMFKRV